MHMAMTKRIHIFLFSLPFLALAAVPYAAFAAWSFGDPIVQCDGITVRCGFDAFVLLLNTILQFLVVVSPFLAAIAFTIAGILYVTAGGAPERISMAHSIFGYTALGLVFILSAWLIVKAILSGFGVGPEFDLLGR